MISTQSSSPPGKILKMFDLTSNASKLVKSLFSGSETENMIAAGVVRTIISDITRLYFENKKAQGNGILVFNPEEPSKSKYLTVKDIQQDLAVAEEMMHGSACSMFKKIINFIDKESESDLALVAMIQGTGVALHIIDPKEVNERIDEYSRGLIL